MGKQKIILLLTCLIAWTGLALGQTKSVSGTVVDSKGEPVPGVAVFVEGNTSVGTMTDMDGKYTLANVPGSAKYIVASSLGFKDARKPVAATVNFTLADDAEVLEAAVATGMQQVDRRLMTGSTAKVDADKAKLSGIADISRSLEGQVAGVSVQNVSGTFGTAPKIRVRGATSIYGSSKPLWVVDGVIMEDVVDVSADDLSSGDATTLISSAIAGLNSDDIESFDILKDGSATSIYGARAMAGVIVVTTKKGKAGQSHISYTGEYTYRLKPSYSTFNIMNSQDQMSIYQELQQKGYLNYAETANRMNSGIYGKMYQLITQYDATSGRFGLQNTPEAIAAYLKAAEYRNTDWFDLLFKSSIQHNHSEIDPVYGEVKRDFDINPYSYALNTSRALDPNDFYVRNYAKFNIMHELDNNYINLNVTDFRIQGELKYKVIPELELSAIGAAKYTASSQEHNILDNSNQAMAYREMGTSTIRNSNPFLYTDPDNPYALPISVLPNGGIYERTDNNMIGYDFRTTANFSKTFADKHIVNLFGGMEINDITRHSTWFRGWGLQYNMGEIPNYAYQVFKQGSEQNANYYTYLYSYDRSAAFFANGTYSYKGRYVINGTYRYEGTNKLGKSRSARWLPTWNISGAWNISDEPWWNPLSNTISHLSVKASYSLTADRGPKNVTNSTVVIRSLTPWRPTTDVRETALDISQLANSELTYEKKHELNIGFEAGFFDNRISTTFDWYKRNNYDLIGIVNTPGVGGEVQKYGNVAAMKSGGWELSLTTQNIKKKNFSWTTNFIYSHSHNEVTQLENNVRVIDLITGTGFAKQGYPVRGIFSIPFMGLNEEGLPTFLDQESVYDMMGELEKPSVSVSGIYFQTSDPEKMKFLEYSGSADPTDVGSLGNVFTWKGFRLNVFITYSFGNVVRLDPVFSNTYNDLDSMPKEFNNRWTVPGDELKTDVPVIASAIQNKTDTHLAYAYNAYNYSTARIAKGDFIRMKEISLTYDFPRKWIEPLKMNNLSLKVQATNLFLIYADKKLNGQDPEFFNTGGVAVPLPKQFTVTLKIGL